MNIELENFTMIKDEETNSILVACKDRERTDAERWVVSTMSMDDIKKIHDFTETILSEKNRL